MTLADPPAAPTAAVHVPLTDQVTWKWNPVTGVTGYKWNTENNYATAFDMGTDTARVETGLACNTGYTRFVWSYGACGPSTAVSLTQTTLLDPPSAPVEGTHSPSYAQINWTWNAVAGAAGYRWNTTDDYGTATNVGSATSRLQTGLVCNTAYVSYVWAYNNCGNSISTAMTGSTTNAPPSAPTAGTHVSTLSSVTWNWNAVEGATGYKFNTSNSYSGATDMGTATTFTETGLNCGTNYTRYIWSYNACGESTPLTTSKNTVNCWVCGDPLVISHVAGLVAPVNKTTTYNTVTNVPGLTTKCWITSNLGASNQATSASDNTEAAAGWYWQFNKKQGFKHDGTTRTPNTAWITFIPESLDWEASKDPCLIELGTGWRIPTKTEWEAVDAAGGWAGATGTYNSLLKLHMAGRIYPSTGNLSNRGSEGHYWSGTQVGNPEQGWRLYISPGSATVNNVDKTAGNALRCLKD
jgi:hypothetical protein